MEAMFRDLPVPEKGWVTLTEQPGPGLEPKEDILEGYLEK